MSLTTEKAPNPLDPASYDHRFVKTSSGNRYHLIDQPPLHWRGDLKEAPALLLCHGFPDLWYGWRYQIPAFVSRGWRVICPSQLGYYQTSKPSDLAKYTYKSVAYDMNSILEECGVLGKVVVIGHDWGGMVAWRFCDYFPHRIIAVASVCTPYLTPATPSTPQIPDVDLIRKFLPNFGYQLYFQTPEATREIPQVLESFLDPMLNATYRKKLKAQFSKEQMIEAERERVQEGRLRDSIRKKIQLKKEGKLKPSSEESEYAYYIQQFRQYGIDGGLNWYKTRRLNHLEEVASKLPPFPSHIPALLLPAEGDAALPPSMALSGGMKKSFPGGNLEIRVLKGADHWCLQDETTREQVTNILGDWVENVLAGHWKPSGNAVSKL